MTIVEREWENMEIIASSILNKNNKIMCKLGKKNKKCMIIVIITTHNHNYYLPLFVEEHNHLPLLSAPTDSIKGEKYWLL